MGCTQISVNGILTVPGHKPDIESILRISTLAIIDKTITMRKKIFFTGHVEICVEYAACPCDNTQSTHVLHAEIPFKGLRLHRHARERLESFLKAKVRFCESDMIGTRTINTILILKLCKLKFHRIVKPPDPECCKPFHESVCKALPSHKPDCKQHDSCDCQKTSDDHDCKLHHNSECKPPPHKPDCKQHDSCDCKKPSDDHDCKPHHNNECKPPPHKPDCKQHDDCDCKKNSDDHDCKPHHNNECKPPPHKPDCKQPSPAPDSMPHYSGYCKPATYDDYAYKSHPGGNYKAHEYISSDDFHVPTYIQPCKRMGNSHGVSFGFNYED